MTTKKEPTAKKQPTPPEWSTGLDGITWKAYSPNGFDVLITLHDGSDIQRLLTVSGPVEERLLQLGFTAKAKGAPMPAEVATTIASPAPARVATPAPQAPEGETAFSRVWTTEIGTLSVSEVNGNRMAKLRCKTNENDWSEFGVKVWNEPLALLGIDIAGLELQKAYTVPAEAALVLVKHVPGKQHPVPQKVIGWLTPEGEELIHERS